MKAVRRASHFSHRARPSPIRVPRLIHIRVVVDKAGRDTNRGETVRTDFPAVRVGRDRSTAARHPVHWMFSVARAETARRSLGRAEHPGTLCERQFRAGDPLTLSCQPGPSRPVQSSHGLHVPSLSHQDKPPPGSKTPIATTANSSAP